MKKALIVSGGLFALLLLVAFGGPALFPGAALSVAVRVERGLSHLEKKQVSIQGLTMPYLEGGPKGGPVLLLLHGFAADKDNWTRFARSLTDEYRVIAPDLPGFGESVASSTISFDIASQADRLSLFTEAIGLPAQHVAGNSMGGYLAGVYALRYPKRVKSLIFFDNAGIKSPRPSELVERIQRGENPLIARTPEEFDRLISFVFVETPFIPPPVRSYLAARAVRDRERLDKIWKDVFAAPVPLEERLAEIAAPVLIIWGDQDRVLDVSSTEVMKQALPAAELVVLKACGHMPMVERPEESARIVRGFLEKH